MDFLNKAYAQLVELFRSMSPAARITTALLLGVVVVSLVYLFRYQVVGQDEYLLGGQTFTNSDLAEMETAFAKAGLSDSTIDGNKIRIPRGQKDAYLAALADNGSLPADFSSFIDDVFVNENMLTGTSELRAQKLDSAREKYVSMVVSKMQDIEYATVRYDEEKGVGLRAKLNIRAGVAVKPRGNTSLDAARVQTIRDTVTAFKAGLNPENVTVTDLNAGRAHVGGSGGPNGANSAYAAQKADFEDEWRQKIMNHLAVYPGVVVGVDVELDPKLLDESNGFEVDPKTSFATHKVDDKTTENTTTPGPAGRPGAASNGVVNTPQSVVTTESGAQTEKTSSKSDQRLISSQTRFRKLNSGLTPQKVKVSINVPYSYYAKVWQERNPAAEGEDPATPEPSALKAIETEVKQTIEESLANLVPAPPLGVDPYTPIRVTSFTDIPMAVEEPPGFTDQASTWLAGNWQTIGMSMLGLFSLLMLRGMLKSSVTSSPTPSASDAVAAADRESFDVVGEEEDEAEPAQNQLRSRSKAGGPNLRDELAVMVKEDPDAAANVLRNWIGDAA